MVDYNALKELSNINPEALGPTERQHLVYRNRFNEIKAYSVIVLERSEKTTTVHDLAERKEKTFLLTGVLSFCDSLAEAELLSSKLQLDYEILPRNKTGRTSANREQKFEVCFTGFSKKEKGALAELAQAEGMFVRQSVARTLGLLVCGSNAGPAKLRKAQQLGIPKAFGIEGFQLFAETGEITE